MSFYLGMFSRRKQIEYAIQWYLILGFKWLGKHHTNHVKSHLNILGVYEGAN